MAAILVMIEEGHVSGELLPPGGRVRDAFTASRCAGRAESREIRDDLAKSILKKLSGE